MKSCCVNCENVKGKKVRVILDGAKITIKAPKYYYCFANGVNKGILVHPDTKACKDYVATKL